MNVYVCMCMDELKWCNSHCVLFCNNWKFFQKNIDFCFDKWNEISTCHLVNDKCSTKLKSMNAMKSIETVVQLSWDCRWLSMVWWSSFSFTSLRIHLFIVVRMYFLLSLSPKCPYFRSCANHKVINNQWKARSENICSFDRSL